jgi:SAM-dependent methyltransferase
MILCTKCQEAEFVEEKGETGNKLVCKKCNFEIPVNDNLIVFHPGDSDTHSGIDPCLYDGVIGIEEKHFWMVARNKLLLLVFEKYVNREDSIVEIGAGTANVARYLKENGYNNISIGDVHLKALEYGGKYGVKHRYQFDIIKAPFSKHFDVVGMFDVLEHTDDDLAIAKSVYRMLKKGGKVILTVPAHMWLWSREDAIPGHRRRYEVNQLKDLFEKSGFRVLKVSAFFVSILPLLYLRRLIDEDNGIVREEDLKDRFRVNPVINFVLGKILILEVKLFSNISFKYGGSILLVGEK